MKKIVSITLTSEELTALINDGNEPHISCLSQDCAYNHHLFSPSRCALAKTVMLREGTCRYFKPGKIEDRNDLPGGSYSDFLSLQKKTRQPKPIGDAPQGTDQPEAHQDNTLPDRHDK